MTSRTLLFASYIMRIVRTSIFVLVAFQCTCIAGGAQDANPRMPTELGTAEQQRRFAELAEYVAGEPLSHKRLRAIADMQVLYDEIVSGHAVASFAQLENIRKYVVRTVYAGLIRNPGMNNPPLADAASSMVDEIPRELLAANLTEPRDWVAALWDGGPPGEPGSLAILLMRSAGGFDQTWSGVTKSGFAHISSAVNHRTLKLAQAEPTLDAVLQTMLSRDRYGTVVHLFGTERPARVPTVEEVERHYELLRVLLLAQTYLEERDEKWRLEHHGPTLQDMDYTAEDRVVLKKLAERTEWPVHLFIWDVMRTRTNWRDPDVLNRIVAHGHPIPLRFFARTGMIDPTLVPKPAKDPNEIRPGVRVIPGPQPSTRPAESEPRARRSPRDMLAR